MHCNHHHNKVQDNLLRSKSRRKRRGIRLNRKMILNHSLRLDDRERRGSYCSWLWNNIHSHRFDNNRNWWHLAYSKKKKKRNKNRKNRSIVRTERRNDELYRNKTRLPVHT
jgi:hypothetical protein